MNAAIVLTLNERLQDPIISDGRSGNDVALCENPKAAGSLNVGKALPKNVNISTHNDDV